MENSKKMKLEQPELCIEIPDDDELQILPSTSEAAVREKENRGRFIGLLEYSKTLMEETSEEEKTKIEKRITQQLKSAQQEYISSEKFSSLIASACDRMMADGSNVFPILVEIKNELKKHKQKGGKEGSGKYSLKTGALGAYEQCFSPCSMSDRMALTLTSDTNEDSVSKGNVAEEKNNSNAPSVDLLFSLNLVRKSSLANNKIAEEKLFPKASTSAFASISEGSILNGSASATEKVNESRVISSSAAKSSASQSSPVERRIDAIPVASTSGLSSSKEATKPTAAVKNSDAGRKSPSPSTSSSSSYPWKSKDKEKEAKGTAASKKEDARNAARIKKLERALADLDRAIKKCQKKEMTLDELDRADSAYMKENQYKRRFTVVWKRLCQLTQTPARTGRIVEKKFHYEGSRYKVINAAVEKLINKKKGHEKFPDFSEVLDALKKVNDVHDMGLTEREITLEAERVFKDVGVELQIRRCRDHEELFGCYLTDDFNIGNDPAEKDAKLKTVLTENSKKFESSINELIDTYAEKQKYLIDEDKDDKVSEEDDEEEEDKEEGEDELDLDEGGGDERGGKKQDDDMNDLDDVPLVDDDIPLIDDDVPLVDNDVPSSISDDLPGTAPTTPENYAKRRSKDSSDDIIEIQVESDRSTDPNDEGEPLLIKTRIN